jgi:hypothetical protein
VAERFILTLKTDLLWTRDWQSLAELRQAVHEWLVTYNSQVEPLPAEGQVRVVLGSAEVEEDVLGEGGGGGLGAGSVLEEVDGGQAVGVELPGAEDGDHLLGEVPDLAGVSLAEVEDGEL